MNRVLTAKKILEVRNIKTQSIFWGFLLLFLTLSLILTVTVNNFTTQFTNNVAIYIFLAISSYVLMRKHFNYCIHFGLTRSEFIKASILSRIQNVIVMVLINIIILVIVNQLKTSFSIQHFNLFNWSSIFTNHSLIVTNIWVDFCIGVLVSSAALLSGALYYKWGLVGPISVSVVIVLSASLPFIRSNLFDFFLEVYEQQALASFGWLLIVSIILWACTYLLLNKVDLKRE
ncbi:hypothetical protein ACQKM9_08480 [Viridibacillus sp. NPDC093762]|uniref:hypothetical protein n=1 Tax=Viridibacillus sp. NPDC093762 TaxID=3390720 RepID=UPI003D016A3E